jgi:hypothetical protein
MGSPESNPFYGREHIDPFAKQLSGLGCISKVDTLFLGTEAAWTFFGMQEASIMMGNITALHPEAAGVSLARTSVAAGIVLAVKTVDILARTVRGRKRVVDYFEANADADDVIARRGQEGKQYLKLQVSETPAFELTEGSPSQILYSQ